MWSHDFRACEVLGGRRRRTRGREGERRARCVRKATKMKEEKFAGFWELRFPDGRLAALLDARPRKRAQASRFWPTSDGRPSPRRAGRGPGRPTIRTTRPAAARRPPPAHLLRQAPGRGRAVAAAVPHSRHRRGCRNLVADVVEGVRGPAGGENRPVADRDRHVSVRVGAGPRHECPVVRCSAASNGRPTRRAAGRAAGLRHQGHPTLHIRSGRVHDPGRCW